MVELKRHWQVIVIGAGPAGLAAARTAADDGAEVLLIERAEGPGGILNQCIHDGFGIVRYGKQLCGPEYAHAETVLMNNSRVTVTYQTTIMNLVKQDGTYLIEAVSPRLGAAEFSSDAIILATGCRERSSRQIFLQGDRPSGIFTAGLAQYLINCMGYMPGKNCIILGSGDIGLIMARRLTLEGSYVKGVYEVASEPSGLTRNIVQCLNDYGIPLHLGKSVTELHGNHRLEAVTIMEIDEHMNPVVGTEQVIPCDTLILSVGLIPEHDMVSRLGLRFDEQTRGPIVDQDYMTSEKGMFCCGNALHVNDLVDYVTESGEIAGHAAAAYIKGIGSGISIPVETDPTVRTVVPQKISTRDRGIQTIPFFIRSSRSMGRAVLKVFIDGTEVLHKPFPCVRPPEMMRIPVDFDPGLMTAGSTIHITLEEVPR